MDECKEEVFYEDADFKLSYQQFEDKVFLHMYFNTYKLSVYKKSMYQYILLKEHFKGEGFEKLNTITQNDKFITLFEKTANKVADLMYNNNSYRIYEVYLWEWTQ